MDIEQLRLLQASFEAPRQQLESESKRLEQLRQRFLKKFPPVSIGKLPIHRYVIGKRDSFCYWMENALRELGGIKGGSPADKKFGVYFGKTKGDATLMYRTIGKWGNTPEQAYENVRKEIVSLLDAGAKKDMSRIINNRLSPMFEGKILATYYPDDYVNIFAAQHVDHFLDEFGLLDMDTAILSLEEKRDVMMRFKNSDPVMKSWSSYEWLTFLYTHIGYVEREKAPEALKTYIEPQYPSINRVVPEFIGLEIGEISEKGAPRLPLRVPRQIDFEKEQRRNRKVGQRGELVVLMAEKEFLKSKEKPALADKVKHVSVEDNSLGYDILSYDIDGTERFIEVKSTTSGVNGANFLISSNELDKAKRLDNYHIYMVFEANSEKPKIYRLKKPFDLPEEKLKITPVSFRVTMNLNKPS